MSTNTTQTADERKAQAEALHASISDQVQQLTESGAWQRFLDFASSFHAYTLNNLLLILAQKPDATMIAGFRQWQARGRQVRRGEKSVKIFGYRERRSPMTTRARTPSSTKPAAVSASSACSRPCLYSTSARPTRSMAPNQYRRTPPATSPGVTTTASSAR
ncbi:ArdC family protein [Leifsonia aquatica]|uniref:ArdC family protein n=1 Tax=Leifsonia aquatica TaxID=144185 RepID=UPI001F05455C|nr:ArdC family protein [Leifsonia aquatica]